MGVDSGFDAPDDALRIDASDAVMIPGLVDAHVYAWEGALRGVSPDSGFYDYMALTHGMLGPLMTPDDVATGQRVIALRALEQGVTTIVDNCHNTGTPEHSDAAVEALQDTGIRAVHATGVGLGQPGEHVHDNLLRLRDRFGSDPRITFRLMEVALTLEGWRFAKEHGFGVVAEFGFWVENIDELLASGLPGPDTVLDHCAGLSDEQWKAVAGCGAAVALVPSSDPHYGLGSVTPVLATNRQGIQEAISSDNEFEYGLDLFSEMPMLMMSSEREHSPRGRSRTAMRQPPTASATPFAPRPWAAPSPPASRAKSVRSPKGRRRTSPCCRWTGCVRWRHTSVPPSPTPCRRRRHRRGRRDPPEIGRGGRRRGPRCAGSRRRGQPRPAALRSGRRPRTSASRVKSRYSSGSSPPPGIDQPECGMARRTLASS